MRTFFFAALLGLALVSGCASLDQGAGRKVRLPLWGVSGGGSFSGTLTAGTALTLTGATSGTTGLSAAAVTTSSVTYSLPPGDGNAFSVLTTNGSHALNWQTLQAGSGITLTRSGNTTTIASTGGGGGGGSTAGVTGWPNAVWSTGGTFSYAAPNIAFQTDGDAYIMSPGSGGNYIHTAAHRLYWGLNGGSDSPTNVDFWYANKVSSSGGNFEFSPVTDATGSLGWNAGWLNAVIYRVAIPETTLDASGFGAGYSVLSTDPSTHTLKVSQNGGAYTNLLNFSPVTLKSSNYTVTSAESGTTFVMPSTVSAGETFTMPVATVGLIYTFVSNSMDWTLSMVAHSGEHVAGPNHTVAAGGCTGIDIHNGSFGGSGGGSFTVQCLETGVWSMISSSAVYDSNSGSGAVSTNIQFTGGS